jgi:protocatechuate 3,4-dioxygenase beta subunit
MEKAVNRRNLLKKLAMAVPVGLVSTKALAESCGLTPPQTEGPFYPIADQLDKNTDLTKVDGRALSARGEVCLVSGIVQDEKCRPIAGALVEIWQACDTGKYNHPADPNPAKLDPNFQYWGRTVTNEKGEYLFKTIIPGAYPATNTWMRPPHIHFKAGLRGYEELTTQMYWKGHPLNAGDRILQSLSPVERDLVLVDFDKSGGIPRGNFNLTLRSL